VHNVRPAGALLSAVFPIDIVHDDRNYPGAQPALRAANFTNRTERLVTVRIMEVLYLLVPLALLLSAGAVAVFAWAARDGQFDDLETPAVRILLPDEEDA
jgi:cbb3-type cytochrome oxidase maturation protein